MGYKCICDKIMMYIHLKKKTAESTRNISKCITFTAVKIWAYSLFSVFSIHTSYIVMCFVFAFPPQNPNFYTQYSLFFAVFFLFEQIF